MLAQFEKRMVEKTRKKRKEHFQHKTTKSFTKNNFLYKEYKNTSSNHRQRPPSAFTQSNKKINSKPSNPPGMIVFRHSERREMEVQ